MGLEVKDAVWKKIKFGKTLEIVSDAIVILGVMAYILTIFKPQFMLSETFTTGGDMGSHMYAAKYMVEYLVPNYKLAGWSMDWYAGFPAFEYYFPLPFLWIAILEKIFSFKIAFKLVTASGVFLLPLTTYVSMRLIGFRYPMPALACAFSLNMLFNEEYSMWGGNIKSTLAGQFTFTIGLALTVLFLGLIYAYAERKKYCLTAGITLAAVPLCHVYTLIWGVVASMSIMFLGGRKDFIQRTNRMWTVYLFGFMLSAFWSLRHIYKFQWATPFGAWRSQSIWDAVPTILTPYYFFAGLAIVLYFIRPKKELGYIIFWTSSATAIYGILHMGITEHLLDVRFLPFAYLGILYMAAYTLAEIIGHLRGKAIGVFIVVILTFMWVNNNQAFLEVGSGLIRGESGWNESVQVVSKSLNEFEYVGDVPGWVKWNYEGYENKAGWGVLNETFNYMNTLPKARVVHEFSSTHSSWGTPRTLELIPFFTKHPVLEGLYIEASLSSPYHFYMQSEYSTSATCPMSWMRCTQYNLENAKKHFKYFAPTYFLASTDALKKELQADSDFKFMRGFPNGLQIFSLNEPSPLIEVPYYKPQAMVSYDWKVDSMKWWKNVDETEVPLVFFQKESNVPKDKFSNILHSEDLDAELPRIKLVKCKVAYEVYNERVDVETSCPGQPHLIKISYNPSWKVIGADEIYLASPSFMLVYPNEKKFTLYYGTTLAEKFAIFLSYSGLILVFAVIFSRTKVGKKIFRDNGFDEKGRVYVDKLQIIEEKAVAFILGLRRHWIKILILGMVIVILYSISKHFGEINEDCNSICLGSGFSGGQAAFPYMRAGSDHYDMGFTSVDENRRRVLKCTAQCDESRGEFVYVSGGYVKFNMESTPTKTHKMTLRIDDSYWCRTMDIKVNGKYVASVKNGDDKVGWTTREYTIEGSYFTSNIAVIEFSHNTPNCIGVDVSDVWLESLDCNCN